MESQSFPYLPMNNMCGRSHSVPDYVYGVLTVFLSIRVLFLCNRKNAQNLLV